MLLLISKSASADCIQASSSPLSASADNQCIENPKNNVIVTTSVGLHSSFSNTISINRGVIDLREDSYFGIVSEGIGASNINYGEIIGQRGVGIQSWLNESQNINYGTIRLGNESSVGINAMSNIDGSTARHYNYGIINVSGIGGGGIMAEGPGTLVNNYGSILINNYKHLTLADWARGISNTGDNGLINNFGIIHIEDLGEDTADPYFSAAVHLFGNSAIVVNSGIIETTGNGVRAILIESTNGSIFNSGTVSARGENSYAIYINIDKNNNVINLQKGSVIIGDISGDPGNTGNKLNFNLGAGASYDYSVTGPWTIADLNNRPMVLGSAHAAGIGNVVTASQSLYERTSQISQSIDDRLRIYDLKQNTDQPYWINTYYSDSGRGGQGLLGSNLSFNQYRSGVTAGFNVKNSYTPTELIVNYEYSKLNIDEGNQGISSNSVMAGLLFPDMTKVLTGTLSAKAFLGYSDYSGDRKVLTNDVAYDGSRNVTASYQSTQLNVGAAWTKTLYQTDKMTLDTLVGMDLNTQHINAYSESDLFKWRGRTINQLQERAQVGMEMKPLVNPLTLFGRIGIERRDLISGENQNFSINNSEVSYKDTNQRNTYATFNAGAYYPLTPTVKAYAQVRYYDSTKNIDSLAGSVGISGQF